MIGSVVSAPRPLRLAIIQIFSISTCQFPGKAALLHLVVTNSSPAAHLAHLKSAATGSDGVPAGRRLEQLIHPCQ